VKNFWDKVDKTEVCWLWTACKDRDGYGIFYYNGTNYRAHRMAYELIVGPIPEGLTIDHLCRVRACVNPDHLEPVTQRENVLRGDTVPAKNAKKTHCKQGHPYSGYNLYIRTNGYRSCRTCGSVWTRKWRKKQRGVI